MFVDVAIACCCSVGVGVRAAVIVSVVVVVAAVVVLFVDVLIVLILLVLDHVATGIGIVILYEPLVVLLLFWLPIAAHSPISACVLPSLHAFSLVGWGAGRYTECIVNMFLLL